MNRPKIYYLVTFSILFLVFYTNLFGVLNSRFNHFQSGSDNLILGRLSLSNQEGILFESGLSGHFGNYMEKDQTEIYLENENLNFKTYQTYCSQIALQGIIFSGIDLISPFSKNINLSFFYCIAVFLNSLLLTLFIVWIKNQFNFITSFFTLLMILSSYWIIIFSKSLWWSLWTFYMPFVFLLFFLERNKFNKISNFSIFKWSFLMFFAKCLFSGYEYITTAVFMYFVPFVYYGILDSWRIKYLFQKVFYASIGVLCGIFITFFILILQLENLDIKKMNGVNYIIETLARRSYDSPNKYDGIMYESMKVPIIDVVKTYFNSNIYNITTSNFSFNLSFLHFILLLVLVTIVLLYYFTKNKNPKIIALTISFWVSITAPLSWVIMFKSHSYIHTHINLIIWYLPFILLGYIMVSYLISILIEKYLIKKLT